MAKKELNLGLYKAVLNGVYSKILPNGDEERLHRVTQTGIRSNHYEIYTQEVNKKGLAAYDDKRWICRDGISTYAHGHYTTIM